MENYITKRGFKSLYGVDQTVLQAYLYKFTRSGKSASTAARNMASLKCFYNFAVISGKLLQNPVKGTQRFHRRKKKLPEIMTNDEVDRFAQSAEAIRF